MSVRAAAIAGVILFGLQGSAGAVDVQSAPPAQSAAAFPVASEARLAGDDTTQPLADIRDKTDLALLAVVDNVDAETNLLVDDFIHRTRRALGECRSVNRPPLLAINHRGQQIVGTR